MKYLLTSSGYTTPEIVDACEKLANKDRGEISVGIINEAYAVEIGDKRWMIQEFQRIADNFGGIIEVVDLLALNEDEQAQRLENVDVIHVIGGNTDYLRNVFQTSGFENNLKALNDEIVYVGSSAGSMVLGKRLPSVVREVLYDGQREFSSHDYLGYFDFAVVPHMNSVNFEKCRKDIVLENLTNFKTLSYCLDDSQALVISDDKIDYVGGEPLIIQNGAII